MEVLNAAGLNPLLSLHKAVGATAERKPSEPKQQRLLITRLSSFTSALAASGLAKALTYEEILSQSPLGGAGGSPLNIDLGGLFDGVASFAAENPLVVGGGALAVAVPLILSQVLKKPKNFGVESARRAFEKLAEDGSAQLLDIREGKDFKEVGSPDLRSLKKKAVAITYRRDDKLGFLKKLELKFKDTANTTLFILDKFDGNSELVAELVTVNGFKAAYAIKDGAEGPRGWVNSGLPWSPPKKALALDFGDLKDAVAEALGESSDGLPVTLGVAAAAGLGILAFTEVETALQLLGSVAIIQLVTKKLLFVEDRKATLQQVDEFLNTKVAPKELLGEIKMIGKALLPSPTSAKASLPAPADEVTETSTMSASAPVPEAKIEVKEAITEPPAEVNSVPKAEVKEETIPGLPRPLSPYPYYPDFKPPSSPSPSPP